MLAESAGGMSNICVNDSVPASDSSTGMICHCPPIFSLHAFGASSTVLACVFFFYPPFLLSTLVSRLFKYGKNKKTNNKGENRFGDMLSYSEVKCRSADCTRW